MSKKIIIWPAVIITVAIFFLWLFYKKPIAQMPKQSGLLTYKIITVDTAGWGYIILVDDKPYIIQKEIPAIGGNKSFADSLSAIKVAKFIIQKLKTQALPALTIEDLKELEVIE